MQTLKQPRTHRLLAQLPTGASVRLLAADRAFLRDLARVQLISASQADRYHYDHLKSGAARSLERLERAGLLSSKLLYVPDQAPTRIYSFASREVARAFGGDLPVTGAKRTDYHEVITSQTYFDLGRPDSFRLARYITDDERRAAFGGMAPDATYVDAATGELVAVEADSGHYSRAQILEKMARWQHVRQVWAQPGHCAARVPPSAAVRVLAV